MIKIGDTVKISSESLLMQESSILSKYKNAIGIIVDKRDIKSLVKFVDSKLYNPRWFYNDELILIKESSTDEEFDTNKEYHIPYTSIC